MQKLGKMNGMGNRIFHVESNAWGNCILFKPELGEDIEKKSKKYIDRNGKCVQEIIIEDVKEPNNNKSNLFFKEFA